MRIKVCQSSYLMCSCAPRHIVLVLGVSSEKENVFESDLGTSSFFNNTQDRTSAESVVLSVGQRKLILSTDILRLVPANRPPLLPTAKRHRTTVFPQQTPKRKQTNQNSVYSSITSSYTYQGCKSLFEVVGAILGEGGYYIIFGGACAIFSPS